MDGDYVSKYGKGKRPKCEMNTGLCIYNLNGYKFLHIAEEWANVGVCVLFGSRSVLIMCLGVLDVCVYVFEFYCV